MARLDDRWTKALMLRLLLAFLSGLALAATPAAAEVEVRFFSRDLGEVFPHAFFEVEGDGVAKRNYGFSAKTISPAILFGPVRGEIVEVSDSYVAKSRHHFTLTVDDAGYRRLLALVEEWRSRPGRSYDLNTANCVSFVAAAVRLLGLRTNPATRFGGKPKSFLTEVARLNPGLTP